MEWIEIFKDYIDIKQEQVIYSFCDEENNWFPELKHIFLHKTKSEMFIMIDIIQNIYKILDFYKITYERNDEEINYQKLMEKVIRNWEKSVLSYLNFELEDGEKNKFLKYNITLVILCEREKIGKGQILETSKIVQEEKSTNICRKIFIFNESDRLDSELNYLPFYFDDIKHISSSKLINLENELNKIVKDATIYLDELDKNEDEGINVNN